MSFITHRERVHIRAHVLLLLDEYGPMTASDLRHRANTECILEMFDALPSVSPQGITAKLRAMARVGLVEVCHVKPTQWKVTDRGEALVWEFVEVHKEP